MDQLHRAVGKVLASSNKLDSAAVKLISVKNQAASYMTKDEADLTECRSRLCKVCRDESLYVCDVAEGWSTECALIKHNDS